MIYNPKRKTYLMPITYIISQYIYEYDISKANINILFYKGIIDEKEFNYYYNLSRGKRQYLLGNIQKDKEISKTLSKGLAEIRERFIKDNNITDRELLSVKNDAIFLVNKEPLITKFDNIEFIKKNTYTSFFYINKLEMYYFLDVINGVESIDIKGINDNVLISHQYHFIEILCAIFEAFQTKTIEYTIDLINNIYNKYINREMDLGYYREFNSSSMFRITRKDMTSYLLNTIDPNNIKYLDISFNAYILKELHSIASTIYFNKR